MDIVLGFFDTLILDRAYAAVLPTLATARNGMTSLDGPTLTFSSRREMPTAVHAARRFFSIEPTEYAYMSAWSRDSIWRQGISLYLITLVFGFLVYFICSSLSYVFIFDHATFMHPKYLKNQVRLEIRQSLEAIPIMSIFTMIPFLGEVRGYGQLYDRSADAPFALYNYLQFPFFILFTDCFIYLIHRGLHHPRIYKTLHKRHHKWIMPTPFASHAFHPLDGFAQSVPYHVYPYLFPLNKVAYIALFIFINLWTVFIHDGEYVSNSPIINGAACHTMHHLYFNYNYGQFTTLWDRLGGSYRQPNVELFRRESKMSKTEWERQIRETETMVKELEGDDDRKYKGESEKKTL